MRRLVSLSVLFVMFAACFRGGESGPAPAPQAQAYREEVGTLHTVAGPGFCPRETAVDRQAALVHSLAVDRGGDVYVQEGLPSKGTIRLGDGTTVREIASGGASSQPAPVRVRVGGRRVTVASPDRLAAAPAGGVYVALRDRIVKATFDPPGLTPVAGGTSTQGGPRAGDGGPALQAGFGSIRGIAADPGGNLYVAESRAGDRYAVRYVNLGAAPVTLFEGADRPVTVAPGAIQTLVGEGRDNRQLEGVFARQGAYRSDLSVLAATGRLLYLVESGPTIRIRAVNTGPEAVSAHGVLIQPGMVETITDSRRRGGQSLGYVTGASADTDGNLYLADPANHRIVKVAPGGRTSAFAGRRGATAGGYNGNGKPALQTMLNSPFDVEAGSRGNVYFSDRQNGQARFVDATGVVRSAPGNRLFWKCLSGAGSDVEPQPAKPSSVVSLGEEVLFPNATTGQIVKRDGSGRVVPVVGAPQAASADQASSDNRTPLGPGSRRTCPKGSRCGPRGRHRARVDQVLLDTPTVVEASADGIYIVDAGGSRVGFANLSRRTVIRHGVRVPPGHFSTVAGAGALPESAELRSRRPGNALEVALGGGESPAMAADRKGNLYFAESAAGRVSVIDRSGRIAPFAGIDAPAERRDCCSRPRGLALDAKGNLYVSDGQSFRIWLVNAQRSPITAHGQTISAGSAGPVAGTGVPAIPEEGVLALQSALAGPAGLAAGPDGSLYLADMAGSVPQESRSGFAIIGHTVRKVDPSGVLTTVAGVERSGFNGDGLRGALSALNAPGDVSLDACGDLLIADSQNDLIRRLILQQVCLRSPK